MIDKLVENEEDFIEKDEEKVAQEKVRLMVDAEEKEEEDEVKEELMLVQEGKTSENKKSNTSNIFIM